ncbi:type VII secretion integral membrane protein EccD [Speluncibacter jeojiensis]|uniref:Type VII secretion integral membrane protein EccD n=1 Tax=Speluncibacter jeojiensis TaxID=2710754 RepID=A0A9X4M5C9_9ACTN|nr:type VII secretion integral membrane protein EccD [Corynebacteriales bacterium D3-21]
MSVPVPADTGARRPRGAGAQLCRVSILGEHTQMDIALPASVPVAALVPELVTLVESRRSDLDRTAPDTAVRRYWTLQRIGQAPFNDSRTLSELGVRDGDLLLLRPESVADMPPLFDDVIDAVALVGDERYRRWTAQSARVVGCVATLPASLAGAGVLLRGGIAHPGLGLPLAALVVALCLLVAGVLVARLYDDVLAGSALGGAAYPLTMVGGALLVPGPLGAPHLLLGAALTTTAAVIMLRLSGTGLLANTAVIAASALTAVSALVSSLVADQVPAVGAGLAVVSMLGLVVAPRLTIMLARLPLPPVPRTGSTADPDGVGPQSDVEAIGPIGAVALPSAGQLEVRTIRANNYLTGLIAGLVCTAVAGAVIGCNAAAGPDWPGVALAGVLAVVLMLRGRSHTDLAQATVLIGAGVALVLATVVTLALGDPDLAAPLFASAALTLVGGIGFGVIAPQYSYSPVLRRSVELFEYALIATVAPLMVWVMGLYGLMRGL